MKKIDELTLSRYLDGALDYTRCSEVASSLEEDAQSSKLVLDYLKTHVLLKCSGREILEEKIPPQIESTIRVYGDSEKNPSRLLFPFLQVGVAVILVFFGYYSGQFTSNPSNVVSTTFPAIPIELEATVNAVLEFEKSGTTHTWEDSSGKVTATVMPVKTYRDKSGGFYRFYFIDLQQSGTDRQLAGVAYRTEEQQWQTRSVFLRDEKQNPTLL